MRWPLRNQIMLPMVLVMLLTLVGVSVLNAYLSVRRARGRIERQLKEVTGILTRSNFPLTNAVLRQMQGLSGAEYVLTDADGQVIARSSRGPVSAKLPVAGLSRRDGRLALSEMRDVTSRRYFHAVVPLERRRKRSERPELLYILYPREAYSEALRQAVYPPLVIGGVAMILVGFCGVGVASRVTRPLGRLQAQVDQIAKGDFRPVALSHRNDEILDLGKSVNRMAQMLARYEDEVRRSEKLRTLGQLGSGIAHQMRNSVTGCRMAIGLHRRECPARGQSESLDVAQRQLVLMEKHLQRFLSLGKPSSRPHTQVDLAGIVQSVLPLVRPTAQHVGVQLDWAAPRGPLVVNGDPEALEQLVVNLLLNGIEAAVRGGRPTNGRSGQKQVRVGLHQEAGRARLEVWDSGPGPAAAVRDKLFEPFVSDKPDGTGLGLSVAREIAQAHEGSIWMRRHDGMTCFLVELPLRPSEVHGVEIAGRR